MALAKDYLEVGIQFSNFVLSSFWVLKLEVFHNISIPDMKVFFQKRIDVKLDQIFY